MAKSPPIDFTLPEKLARYHAGTDSIRDARTGEEVPGVSDLGGYVLFSEWFARLRDEIQNRSNYGSPMASVILAELLLAKALNWPS